MAKKPTLGATPSYAVLTTLEPAATSIPPGSLAESGQKLWQSVMAQYRIEDAGGIQLLRLACEATDRCERLRKIINADGELVEGKDGGPPREHPLLRAESLARGFVAQTLTRLGLSVEPLRAHSGRPSNRSGAI